MKDEDFTNLLKIYPAEKRQELTAARRALRVRNVFDFIDYQAWTGVEIGGPGNAVGGTNAGAGNIIAFNGYDGGGVFTTNGVDLKAGSTGSTVLGNSIFSNLGLGIDVNADFVVTPGFPVITLASNTTTATVIKGSSTPNTAFRLELFSNPVADPSGYGEGKTLLISTNITTDAGGNFTVSWPSPILPGRPIRPRGARWRPGSTSEGSSAEARLQPIIPGGAGIPSGARDLLNRIGAP